MQEIMSDNNEIMEVMMTGGDGGSMNEETLSQVVNMLQMEGQLGHGNQTIIIRQPGSNEVQMIQASSNGSEVVVTKASEEEIEALQLNNGLGTINPELLEESQDGQVVMMDEGGNLVQGVVQMENTGTSQQIQNVVNRHRLDNGLDVKNESVGLLEGFDLDAEPRQILPNSGINLDLQLSEHSKDKPYSFSTGNANKYKRKTVLNDKVVSIKINTGLDTKRKISRQDYSVPKNVIKISTVTGQQKYQLPKFHKCDSCAINFVSKVAYLNHMENCPSKRKLSVTPGGKSNLTYTCVFCETKFTSRLILMQHVRTCEKARSTKTFNNSTSKVKPNATSESKLKSISDNDTPSYRGRGGGTRGRGRRLTSDSRIKASGRGRGRKYLYDEGNFLNEKMDSEDEDDKFVVYDDDDDDFNEEMVDDVAAEDESRKSQKHLGPIVVNGVFKCRDCSRTFGKEPQYNRHIKVCTNAPLSIAHADAFDELQFSNAGVKRKRLHSADASSDDGVVGTPLKKRQVGSKIIPIESSQTTISKGPIIDVSDSVTKQSRLNRSLNVQSVKPKQNATGSKNIKKVPFETNFLSTRENIENNYMANIPLCGLCGDKFKATSELALHTQKSHSEDLLNLRDLLDGKGCGNSLKCPLCNFYYINSHTLLFHLVAIHSRELKFVNDELMKSNLNLKCPFCKKLCSSQDLLREHISTKHLDMLFSRPIINNTTPVSVDVNRLIKESGDNDSPILPTKNTLNKQEKVLCPDCGLFFIKSYFEHHRCASESYSPTARRFVCSESQCVGMAFYKLVHLLTHLQQVHDKNLTAESVAFESLTQFLDWLKEKEATTKMKYTRAMQRMKQGKMSSVWICHRFHNAMKDPPANGPKEISQQKVDRSLQCYSRIHVETTYNPFTLRYDGETSIKFFPEHQHVAPPKVETPMKEKIVEQLTNKDVVIPQTISKQPSAFSTAEELKQLLEDDEIGESTLEILSTMTEDTLSLADSLDLKTKEAKVDVMKEEETAVDRLEKELAEALTSVPEVENLDEDKFKETSKPSESDLQTPQKTDLSSFTDTDLLLDKMLSGVSCVTETIASVSTSLADVITPITDDVVITEDIETTECESVAAEVEIPSISESDSLPVAMSDVTTEAKVSDVDDDSHSKIDEILESFGVSTSVPDNVSEFVSESVEVVNSEVESIVETDPKVCEESESLASKSEVVEEEVEEEKKTDSDLNDSVERDERDSELEENTYVLPADIEEWQKLFELVQSQVNNETLTKEDLKEAKYLLTFENKITKIPIEKQVQVFNSLCTLANVQMS